jgi:hypothetical protein
MSFVSDVDRVELTDEGKRRATEILRVAKAQGRRKRARRMALRAGAVTVLLIGVASILLKMQMEHESPPVANVPPSDGNAVVGEKLIMVRYIQTDPDIIEKLRLKPAAPTWRSIDDEQLLRELELAGKPAALAYVDGRTMLMYR